MSIYFQKLATWAGSRLARNIYFWVALFILKQSDVEEYHDHPQYWYYGLMLVFLSFFIGLSYFNNFFLMPRFLVRKKYVAYFLSAATVTLITAVVYTWLLKYLMIHAPGLDPFRISIVSSPITADLSLSSVLEDMGTYFTVMVVWIFVFTLLGYFNEYSKKLKVMQETINKHVEVELSFLKSQINPHFLFNTLNNLYGLALRKSDEAPATILKLSSIMRYLLYESNVKLISFEKEKEVMEAYIDLELLRIVGSHNFRFQIEADRSCEIPPLLWLPVLENIFKHGTRIIRDELFIDFRFMIKNRNLLIYSKNKFGNMRDESTAGGIGLGNLKKRLALLYPGKHVISTGETDSYYITEIDITLNG